MAIFKVPCAYVLDQGAARVVGTGTDSRKGTLDHKDMVGPDAGKNGENTGYVGSLRIQICPWISGFPLYSYSGDGIETINPTLGKGLDS